jgi:hypothetical protein
VKQCATNLVSRTIIRTALQVAPKVKQEFAAKDKANAAKKAAPKPPAKAIKKPKAA